MDEPRVLLQDFLDRFQSLCQLELQLPSLRPEDLKNMVSSLLLPKSAAFQVSGRIRMIPDPKSGISVCVCTRDLLPPCFFSLGHSSCGGFTMEMGKKGVGVAHQLGSSHSEPFPVSRLLCGAWERGFGNPTDSFGSSPWQIHEKWQPTDHSCNWEPLHMVWRQEIGMP